MRIKVIFANVIQCMIHCGYNEKKENIFAGFHPEKYVEYFKDENPDNVIFRIGINKVVRLLILHIIQYPIIRFCLILS